MLNEFKPALPVRRFSCANRLLQETEFAASFASRQPLDLRKISLDIKFARHSGGGHIANRAKHRAARPPWTVVLAANRPGHTRVTIRVTAIQLVFIIQAQGYGESLFRACCP